MCDLQERAISDLAKGTTCSGNSSGKKKKKKKKESRNVMANLGLTTRLKGRQHGGELRDSWCLLRAQKKLPQLSFEG